MDDRHCRYKGLIVCLRHKAPRYLTNYCIPIFDVASRHYLVVPRHSLSSYGCRAFAVADPTAWNSLSDDLRDPTLSTKYYTVSQKMHQL